MRARRTERAKAAVVIEAKNGVDGQAYRAPIVPKHEILEYWPAPPFAAAEKQPQHAPATLTATITARPSMFALRKPAPLLILAYGIGRIQFDAFCALVLDVLSACDFHDVPSAPNRQRIEEICARQGLTAEQGETRCPSSSRPIPIVMLSDRDASARGY